MYSLVLSTKKTSINKNLAVFSSIATILRPLNTISTKRKWASWRSFQGYTEMIHTMTPGHLTTSEGKKATGQCQKAQEVLKMG